MEKESSVGTYDNLTKASDNLINDFAGIKMPVLHYKFKVRFTEPDGTSLSFSDALTNQVVSISAFTQDFSSFNAFGLNMKDSKITIKFQEDAQGETQAFLQALATRGREKPIAISIDLLNGNDDVVYTKVIKKAHVSSIKHGALTYISPNAESIKLSLKIPEQMGKLINTLIDDPAASVVYSLLAGSSFVLYENREKSYILQTDVTFSYGSDEVDILTMEKEQE